MYLLDTCAFIWLLEDSPNLSLAARAALMGNESVFLSLTSLWEIAIKKTIHKLELNKTTLELAGFCEQGAINLLPIEAKYFDVIQELPMIHGDPFDRLIMATALTENLTILTDDSKIRQYSMVRTMW